ncbi:hypothetical protein HOLleu_36903 [Holothuria leucospilota]|uniref:Uncharacterized protein n=1 Tax=Holothuria leucospilota TaxID=206669 RepID=A0A9Q0YKJ8_HOLLE|nr:hypothetical protein HOLleu_36903 [Holothuria leucospilota]
MVLEKELLLGISQPEFPTVCDFLEKNYFCSVTNSIRDDVISFAPNVCQIPWGPSSTTSCQVSLEVSNITPGFRERLLLRREDPVYFIASESYEQYFDIAVKFPCVEEDGN